MNRHTVFETEPKFLVMPCTVLLLFCPDIKVCAKHRTTAVSLLSMHEYTWNVLSIASCKSWSLLNHNKSYIDRIQAGYVNRLKQVSVAVQQGIQGLNSSRHIHTHQNDLLKAVQQTTTGPSDPALTSLSRPWDWTLMCPDTGLIANMLGLGRGGSWLRIL